jgi:hypothetical protein
MTINEPVRYHRKLAVGSERSFGIVFAILFAVIGLLPLYRGGVVRWWAIAVGAIFLTCASLAPGLLRPFNYLWLKVGALLHYVVNPVIIGVLYFGVLVPIGFLMRVFGKDLLNLKFDKTRNDYWIPRDPSSPRPGGMTKQF